MVQEVLGALTVGLAELPTRQGIDARPESTTESAFAEVLADVVHVERVSVDSNFFDDLGADSMVMARFCARVRKRPDLPAVSIKDIYQHPTIKSLATAVVDTTPMPVERVFADVLAEVMSVDRVPVDSNFFDDLGADSMVMARFCARVRKRPDLPAVSIKDIYEHPTVKSLATALGDAAPLPVPVESPAPTAVEVDVPKRAGTLQVVLCGALQLLIFLGYSYLAAVVIAQGYEWISAGLGVLDIYLRSVLSGCALFGFLFTIPILAKWILIGRWKPQQIRIWSLAYVRFWVVKTLVRRNPIVFLTGSPLFNLYLRALGAKIGRGVVIFSTHVPICTDLLSIGDGTVIRKDSFINGYRAHGGFIQVGAITIGKNALISEQTVIDVETTMGDGTQTQLGADPSVQNMVRFAFFGGEENGAEGSTGYVEGLSAADRQKIKLYLNVDMVASPNGGYFVQGGKGGDPEEAGPAGSATIARVLADQLAKAGVRSPEIIEFVGDDESAFIEAGIPVGGAENGDEDQKMRRQAKDWGGQAGERYDRCYHQACDNIDNVNRDVLSHYLRALAGTLAHFATSTAELR